jgi:hypothetical protein
MLFWKEHKEEKKCSKCGKTRYIKIINDDSETVTMVVARYQLCYMPITRRLKQMFLLKRTVMHIRWHKDDEWENKEATTRNLVYCNDEIVL